MNASKAAIAEMRPEILVRKLTDQEARATLLGICKGIEQADGAVIREALLDAAAWTEGRA